MRTAAPLEWMIKSGVWPIDSLEEQMLAAATQLDFERAAKLRDEMLRLKGEKIDASGERSHRARRRSNRGRK